jgi:hypothetical protein
MRSLGAPSAIPRINEGVRCGWCGQANCKRSTRLRPGPPPAVQMNYWKFSASLAFTVSGLVAAAS